MRNNSLKIILFPISLLCLMIACTGGRPGLTQVPDSIPTAVVVTTSPIVIVVTATPLSISPTSTPPPFNENLDNYAQDWKIFTEGAPIAEVRGASDPSLDGNSLKCSNKGGAPYSNVHCYMNLPPEPDVSSFTLSMSFLFTPEVTCNNQGGKVSIVQALEFSMSNWTNARRFEFALQWQNVGDGAPQWRYWDPHQDESRRWKPIDSKITQCLESDQWHTLQLKGSTNGIAVYYESFTIDNQTFDLNYSTARVNTPGEIDRLAVAIQLDGNANQTPYDVFIDQVNFTRQGAGTGASPTSAAPTDCSMAKIDEFPVTNGYVDRNAIITWTPSSCVMNVQIYQDGKLQRENKLGDASGTVNLSGFPAGTIEIKIWVPEAGSPSDSRTIQIQ